MQASVFDTELHCDLTGIHFSYNQPVAIVNNFSNLTHKCQKLLSIWSQI